jgi:hypothetical protein
VLRLRLGRGGKRGKRPVGRVRPEFVVVEVHHHRIAGEEARVDVTAFNYLQMKGSSSLHSSLYCRSNGTETSYGTTSEESAK